MNALLIALQADAAIVEEFFTREVQVERLPFVHSFPKNCCELVSAFFAAASVEKYPRSCIEVVSAFDSKCNEWHCWVEIDGVVVDATAHQFPEYQCPLVCVKPSPLESRFSDIERFSPQAALGRLNSRAPEIQPSIIFALQQEIAKNQSCKPMVLEAACSRSLEIKR